MSTLVSAKKIDIIIHCLDKYQYLNNPNYPNVTFGIVEP